MAAFHRKPQYRHGYPTRPDFGYDARGHQYRFAAGTHILFRLHEGRTRFPAYYAFLSLFTMSMLGLVVATNYLPDVSVLGVGGRVLLSADWFLLYEAGGYCRFEEGVYRDPFC